MTAPVWGRPPPPHSLEGELWGAGGSRRWAVGSRRSCTVLVIPFWRPAYLQVYATGYKCRGDRCASQMKDDFET